MKTVAVFGDARTGKSALIGRFFGQPFTEEYKPTIEDYYCGKIYIGEHLYHMNIIDTSGSFAFPAMERLIMQKADTFIFVYSYDDPKSFDSVKKWLKRLSEIKDIKSVPVLVVCNKADLHDIQILRELQMKIDNGGRQAELDTPELCSFMNECETLQKSGFLSQRKLVHELGCMFLPTSAKLRWNVNRIFQELFAVRQIVPDCKQRRHSVLNKTLIRTMKSMVCRKVLA